MKKIGILTFHNVMNYGAMLQAYALQSKLEDLGEDAEIIDYRNKNIENRYKIINPTNIVTVMKSIIKFFMNPKIYTRNKSFHDFRNKYMKLSQKYTNEEYIKKEYTHYDFYITGSDQVWNGTITKGLSDIYTLNFPTSAKKISYAASVGSADLINQRQSEYKSKISGIDFISVREEDAKKELEKIIDKPIEVVLDPTLLINKEEWNNKLKELKKENEKYILAYVVSPDEEYVKIVNDLSEQTGLRVIHFGFKNPGYAKVLKTAYTEGPLEFVNYIKNAEYVVATSFHATAFSVIFNKKFFIVPHRKTGARVINLLDKLEIKGRTFKTLNEFKSIDYNFDINWDSVNQKLEKERKKSINWLKNVINS